MWIIDDDGDMFNTDHYYCITFSSGEHTTEYIKLHRENNYDIFSLQDHLNEEERLTRYYDLVMKLTGERIDG